MKYVNTDIVFQEIPDEVTLAINLSGCPNRCQGCHSPYLQKDIGTELTANSLDSLIAPYRESITCVCFMGGDSQVEEVMSLCRYIKTKYQRTIKTGWYSGRAILPTVFCPSVCDFVKLGAYIESLGALNKPTTNQRLYRSLPDKLEDITARFWRK